MNLCLSYKGKIEMEKNISRKGFTLIELIIVIGVLAVLALILIPSIINYAAQARNAKNDANARELYSKVTASLAMSTAPAPTSPIAEGGVSCSFTESNGTLLTFACSASQGSVRLIFSP